MWRKGETARLGAAARHHELQLLMYKRASFNGAAAGLP
jgi:hypothetical protein